MDRNWTLWHPACRPSHAHPLLTPPHGFEDLPRDVLEYAHYLGMHFPEDGRFVWLAEEGWFAPLPSGWEMRKDPEGLVYFYDDLTGLSSRHSPNDDHYRSMYYEHKYAGAEDGPYLMQLLSCVGSRGLTDAIRTLSSKAHCSLTLTLTLTLTLALTLTLTLTLSPLLQGATPGGEEVRRVRPLTLRRHLAGLTLG